MGWPPEGRDLETMSRPRRFDWARQGGRDMRPRPRRYARDLRTLNARPALAVCETWARLGRCARSSAHDLGTARVVCAQPGLLGVCTVHPTHF